jgi:hypothetical protein
MWPFRKRHVEDTLATIDQAIDFSAERWRVFSTAVAVSPDMGLRERIGIFARAFDRSLHERFPSLRAAPEEVILLIIAKGVEESRTIPRREIERALGILLPP